MTSIKRLAALVAALGCLAGCGAPAAKEQTMVGKAPAAQTAMQNEPQSETLHVVTTIFPLYDWTRQVLGDNPAGITLTMLMDNGVDLHSYQATADDMVTLAGSDLFLYVGGPSDAWVQSALGQVAAPDMQAVKLLDVLGDKVKREQLVEGMQDDPHEHDEQESETEHEDETAHQGEIEHEDEQEIDEHIWMSLRNAALLTAAIADKLGEIDPDNKAMYVDNASRYIEQLDVLDRQYAQVVEQAPRDTLVVCDRFPLQYLVDDYDLDYYAAFVGCSAETEASFETVTFLANKVNELQVDRVLTIEGTTHKIAQTVIESAGKRNQEILTFDTLQATTGEQIAAGCTYLSVMENNLEVLRQALA